MNAIDIRDPSLYDSWSVEDLDAHLKTLRELRDRKAGMPPKRKVSDLLNPLSEDFLGSGMSLHEWFTAMRLQQLESSFFNQDRRERNRRMQYVTGLAKILAEIEAVSITGTALARGAIEEVIEGDWSGVRQWAEDLGNHHEFFGVREPDGAVDLWKQFAAVLQEAFDTRPGAPAPPKPRN